MPSIQASFGVSPANIKGLFLWVNEMYPTKEKLDSLFYYCRLSGSLIPLDEQTKPPRKNDEGYLVINVEWDAFLAHRCVWIMVYGKEPVGNIDHRNGRRDDLNICNLRIASHSQNAMNRKINSRNTSGHKGVSWEGREGKWKAEIRSGKKRVFRKYFENIDDAVMAVREARERIHGEFCRHA